jgi:acylphosphatase
MRMSVCMHCKVTGRVQGVFFRASTRNRAVELGLNGWVRNMPDGSVEVLACGDEAALETLRGWLHEGPPMARVAAVQCSRVEDTGEHDGFDMI